MPVKVITSDKEAYETAQELHRYLKQRHAETREFHTPMTLAQTLVIQIGLEPKAVVR